MIKLIIKLAIAALVANATWRVGNAYLSYYRFTDSLTQAAQFGGNKTDAELHARMMELAQTYDIPIDDETLTIQRNRDHTVIVGDYTQPIEVAPGYQYPWRFKVSIDTLSMVPNRIDPSVVTPP